MHSHPAGCTIFYKDATFRVTSPAGEVRTLAYRAGDVSCGDAYSHLSENVGRRLNSRRSTCERPVRRSSANAPSDR